MSRELVNGSGGAVVAAAAARASPGSLAEVPRLELPTIAPRPVTSTSTAACAHIGSSPVSLGRLTALAVSLEASLEAVLLAGWGALLHRYTGAGEVVIAIAPSGEPEGPASAWRE